jgi:hypothetical protein
MSDEVTLLTAYAHWPRFLGDPDTCHTVCKKSELDTLCGLAMKDPPTCEGTCALVRCVFCDHLAKDRVCFICGRECWDE